MRKVSGKGKRVLIGVQYDQASIALKNSFMDAKHILLRTKEKPS